MEFRLTDEEHQLLLEILAESHKHLLFEIARADHHEFKVGLRHRCMMLEEIMRRMKDTRDLKEGAAQDPQSAPDPRLSEF